MMRSWPRERPRAAKKHAIINGTEINNAIDVAGSVQRSVKHERVEACAAGHHIRAGAADRRICAVPPIQDVVALYAW
jgi:hypothetical protein